MRNHSLRPGSRDKQAGNLGGFMQVVRFSDIAHFTARAKAFLIQHEAEHNLTLGIMANLSAYPERFQNPYLAAVEDGPKVLATAVMTPPRNVVLSRCNATSAAELFATDLHNSGWSVPAVAGPPPNAEAFARWWQALTGQSYGISLAMRIYSLQTVRPVTGVPGKLRRAAPADRDLLIRWATDFASEALAESHPTGVEELVDRLLTSTIAGYVIWEDGGPVSMSVYSGPTPNGIRIGQVYTPPEHRRKGYASVCVAALSQMLLDQGRTFVFLFTDLANPTSNHIYQEIGYRPVADVTEFKFM